VGWLSLIAHDCPWMQDPSVSLDEGTLRRMEKRKIWLPERVLEMAYFTFEKL
jgi:hypothetical protein